MNEDRASRYHRLRRRAIVAAIAAGAAYLFLLSWTAAAALWRAVSAWTPVPGGLAEPAAFAVFVVLLAAGYELLELPLAAYRNFFLERRYGLSSESAGAWLRDHAKAALVGLLLTLGGAFVVYLSARASASWWWLLCALVFALVDVVLANVTPVVLLPLFYRFRPLEREALHDRLVALSARAGVPVLGAFEWGLGEKTRRANAALVGLGRTRRILVSDTLLAAYTDDEIEVILAHELAHHVHRDIWSAIVVDSLVVAAGLWAAHLIVGAWGSAFGVAGPADPPALPLIVLSASAVSLLMTPAANAWSRYNERRADRYALSLTDRPAAFISAMRRLGAQNLAEERPSPVALWFFHTHPTIDERIDAARRHEAA
jgi:STE24 endopeptidase